MRAQVELLRSEGQSGTSSAEGDYPSPPPGQANGNEQHTNTTAHDVHRALNHRSENDYIHPELRTAHDQQPSANMMPMAPSSGPPPGSAHATAVLQPSPPDLAPAANMTAGPPQDQGAASQTSPPGNGRKQQTRELSQTKRAAQNRAAQVCLRHPLMRHSY